MSHGSAREGISTSTQRYAWVDVGKGVCILLVVLYHVVDKQYLVSFDLPGAARAGWDAVIMGLVPLRMPLFFLLSGFLAARSLDRPWRTSIGPRVLSPYYLYVLWLVIHLVVFLVLPDIADEHAMLDTVPEVLLNLVAGLTSLWYLYALAAYFLIARVVRRFKLPAIGVAAALTVAVEAGWIPVEGQAAALMQNLTYFLLAIYFPALVVRLGDVNRRRTVAVASVAALGILLLAKRAFDLDAAPGLLLVLSLLACVAGVSVSSWATDAAVPGTRRLAALGRATLPIYVMHLPLIAVIQLFIPTVGPTLPTVVAYLYPVVVTAAVVAVCLLLRWTFERIGLAALFTAPWLLHRKEKARKALHIV